MNISSLVQANSIGDYASNISRVLSSSVSKWSGVILATSLTALAGLGIYHWSQSSKAADKSKEDDINKEYFEQVKERVTSAYAYVFGGLTLTAVAAAVAHVSGFSRMILENSFMWVPITILSIGGLVATIWTDKENIKTKHVALAAFNIGMGLMMSPLGFIPRAIVAQAALITLGIGGLLTFTAYMAPDESFLKWKGPLMGALTAISVAGFVACFFQALHSLMELIAPRFMAA